MYVMMAEYLNMGKIIGGGKIKRLIVKFHHILPKLEKQSKINRNIVQVRLRKVSSGYSAAKV